MPRRLVAEFAHRAKEPHQTAELDVITLREREVMTLVANGLSNDEIARKLYMSPATVRTHVSRAMTKLGVRDRAQLVVLAYETVPGTPKPERLTHRGRPARQGTRASAVMFRSTTTVRSTIQNSSAGTTTR